MPMLIIHIGKDSALAYSLYFFSKKPNVIRANENNKDKFYYFVNTNKLFLWI